MINCDLVNKVRIGIFNVDITRVTANRVIKARDMYNGIPKDKGDSVILLKLTDILIVLIRVNLTIKNIFEWFKRMLITKKYVLNNLTIKELDDLCEAVIFEPLAGPKKKELKMQELGIRIAGMLTDEQLKTLLSKLPLLQERE